MPDARSRGPHVNVSHATIVRKSLRRDRILLHLGAKNHRIALIGDAFEHICHLLCDDEPQALLVAWDDVAGGIQAFYARRDENEPPATRMRIFAGRHADGQILGLSQEQLEIVEFALGNSSTPEAFIAEEFLQSARWI